jgi:hypothetical protein
MLQGASPRRTPEGLELTLTLAAGAQARTSRTDDGVVVTFSPAAPPAAPSAVRLSAEPDGAALALSFDFAAPTGAAVFRRGEAVWVVFEGSAPLSPAAVPLTPRGVRAVTAHQARAGRGCDWLLHRPCRWPPCPKARAGPFGWAALPRRLSVWTCSATRTARQACKPRWPAPWPVRA